MGASKTGREIPPPEQVVPWLKRALTRLKGANKESISIDLRYWCDEKVFSVVPCSIMLLSEPRFALFQDALIEALGLLEDEMG